MFYTTILWSCSHFALFHFLAVFGIVLASRAMVGILCPVTCYCTVTQPQRPMDSFVAGIHLGFYLLETGLTNLTSSVSRDWNVNMFFLFWQKEPIWLTLFVLLYFSKFPLKPAAKLLTILLSSLIINNVPITHFYSKCCINPKCLFYLKFAFNLYTMSYLIP